MTASQPERTDEDRNVINLPDTDVEPRRVDQLKIVRQWHRGLCIAHKAHALAATAFNRGNLYLGVPVVILSTVAGTAVFGSLESSPAVWAKIAVGLLSLAAAILASLQTFLRYSELSEKHKIAAVKYGALRREVEEALVTCKEDEVCTREFMSSIRARWDTIDQEAPAVPKRIMEPVTAEFKAKELW